MARCRRRGWCRRRRFLRRARGQGRRRCRRRGGSWGTAGWVVWTARPPVRPGLPRSCPAGPLPRRRGRKPLRGHRRPAASRRRRWKGEEPAAPRREGPPAARRLHLLRRWQRPREAPAEPLAAPGAQPTPPAHRSPPSGRACLDSCPGYSSTSKDAVYRCAVGSALPTLKNAKPFPDPEKYSSSSSSQGRSTPDWVLKDHLEGRRWPARCPPASASWTSRSHPL